MSDEAVRTDRYRIVLCRTEGAGNLGSVCRAMKAMGFRHLDLVNPAPSAVRPELVKEMAIHAYDIFETARYFPTLEDALADSSLSAAFARRQGSLRKTGFRELPDFQVEMAARQGSAEHRGGLISLVFGNEKHGLDKEEVSRCTYSIQIPTHTDFPSLNLAQAVQIACWELRQITKDHRKAKKLQMSTPSRSAPLSIQEFADLGKEVVSIFQNLGFYHKGGEEKAREMWRDLFTRAGVDLEEAKWLQGTMGKLRGIKPKLQEEAQDS